MNILEMPMKFCSPAVLSALVVLGHGHALQAQDKAKPKQPAAAAAANREP